MATEAIAETIRTARVGHDCHHRIGADCTGRIEPGEQYRESKTTPEDEWWPGQWLTWRSCSRCIPLDMGGTDA